MPCAPHLAMVEHSSGLGDRGRETVPAHPHGAQGACDQGQVGTSERADTGPRCLHRPPQPSSATPCGVRLWPTTDDGGVATAGDRADPSQLCRPTRTPVGLGGAASPKARATRRLWLLCRLRRSLCPARARAPPTAPRQRRRGSVDLDGTSPPWASAAHLQSRGTREPQGSTLGGRHCHHCAQEQGTDRAGTPALAPTHTGCGGHMTASPSPTAGCPLEGAAPLLLGGGDQPNAILGEFQARGHTFVQ